MGQQQVDLLFAIGPEPHVMAAATALPHGASATGAPRPRAREPSGREPAAIRERKQQVVRPYDEAFGSLDQVALIRKNLEDAFPFSYVIRVLNGRRDDLLQHLQQRGIGVTVQFTPNHMQPHFAVAGVKLPTTESLFREIVTLPLFAEITPQQVTEVIDTVVSFLKSSPYNGVER